MNQYARSNETENEEQYTYQLKADHQEHWQTVTLEEFIRAERKAGFVPKCASTDPKYWTHPATGGFGSGSIQGRIQSKKSK